METERMTEYAGSERFGRVFSEIFRKSAEDPERRAELDKFQKIADRENTRQDVKMLSYDIQPEYAKQLKDICEKRGIAVLNIEVQTENGYKKNQAWICNTQEKDFTKAVLEARVRSGYDWEIPREYVAGLMPEFRKNNPLKEYKDMSVEQYLRLKENVQKLDPEMKFTLMPKYHVDNGKTLVDVGFLSRTEQKYDKEGEVFQTPKAYNISELVKGLIANEMQKEQEPGYEEELTLLKNREDFKNKTRDELLKSDAITPATLKEAIAKARIPVKDKERLNEILDRYPAQSVRSEFEQALDKSEIPETTKAFLKRGIQGLGKEQYVVHAVRDGNGDWNVEDRMAVCIGKDMMVRTADRETSIITDKDNMKFRLDDQALKLSGKDNIFVVLSAKEFGELERNNNKRKRLNRNTEFLKGMDEEKLFGKDQSYAVAKSDYLIDMMNEKKDKFMLESEEADLQRVEDHPHAIVNTLIAEHDEVDSKTEMEDELNEQEKRVDDIRIEQAIEDFDDYIKNEISEVGEVSEGIRNPEIDMSALENVDNPDKWDL